MKPETLAKISDNKYEVRDNCIYKGNKKICNFYIEKLSINHHQEREISFTIKLVSKTAKSKATIPMCYMNNPSGWLYYEFDSYDFHSFSGKDEFDRTINEIIILMKENGECKNRDKVMGWIPSEFNPKNLKQKKLITFANFSDLSDASNYKNRIKPLDYISEYSRLVDSDVSNILFSYMLLSILSSFDLLGENIRPNFVISLTGGNEFTRRKTALFFTNLFKRNLAFGKNDYNMTHIMSTDSFAEIRFKTEGAKDCVLIAFEPDKRHLNFLINDIYGKRSLDEDHPVRSMCLITTKDIEMTTGNIINVHLPETYTLEKLDEYFNVDNPAKSKSDMLMESIYYYINVLTNKLVTDKFYINNKFAEYVADDYTPGYFEIVPETSEEAAILLSFAYWLYMSEYHENPDPKTEDDIALDMWGIYDIANNLFLTNGKSKDMDFDNAEKVCLAIDAFFKNRINHKKLKKIGGPRDFDDIRMWYDEDYLYIKSENIREILNRQRRKMTFSKIIKVVLAENGLIKTYIKNDGKPEYSVHIQKNLYEGEKNKTKARFVAFSREKCRCFRLFENIESVILNRCQIDVKTKEKEEKN